MFQLDDGAVVISAGDLASRSRAGSSGAAPTFTADRDGHASCEREPDRAGDQAGASNVVRRTSRAGHHARDDHQDAFEGRPRMPKPNRRDGGVRRA
jgi:hypothetical protein